MRRNGYDSYHGRSRVRTFLKVLIVLLLVVLAVAVGALLWLEPYIDYSANGIKINLPFFQQKEPAPATGAPVVVTTPGMFRADLMTVSFTSGVTTPAFLAPTVSRKPFMAVS